MSIAYVVAAGYEIMTRVWQMSIHCAHPSSSLQSCCWRSVCLADPARPDRPASLRSGSDGGGAAVGRWRCSGLQVRQGGLEGQGGMGTSALCCAMISWEVGAEGGRSFKGSRVSAKDRWCDYLGGGWGSRWGGWAWAGAILVVRSGLGSVHIPVAHVVCGGGSGARAFLD